MKLYPHTIHKNELKPYTKINSKWIRDLNVRATIIELLEKKTGVNVCDLELGNVLKIMTPKAQTTKQQEKKVVKLRFHQNSKKLLCK